MMANDNVIGSVGNVGTTVNFSDEDMSRLRMHLAELGEAVANQLPHFRNLLSVIHRTLREDPDVITLLEPEEVAQIVAGMAHDVGETLAVKATAAAKKSKKVTLDDL